MHNSFLCLTFQETLKHELFFAFVFFVVIKRETFDFNANETFVIEPERLGIFLREGEQKVLEEF